MMTPVAAEKSSSSQASVADFTAEYTSKDLILYAIALGFGSDEKDQDELVYLFEQHRKFQAVPSFPLILPFWADKSNASFSDIKSFPPSMMKAVGVLPRKFLRRQSTNPETLPVIQTSQRITWHRPVPKRQKLGDSSIQTKLSSRILSVAPKSVGTFVTNETQIWAAKEESSFSLLCTMQNTNLVLGMPSNDVIAYGRTPTKRPQQPFMFSQTPTFEWTYKTRANQALLYRVASGDSNTIHVVTDAKTRSLTRDYTRPLLHGLCTLGIAVRGILKFLRESSRGNCEFVRMEANFTNPVLVGDCLKLKVWQVALHKHANCNHGLLHFQVWDSDAESIAIDQGLVEVKESRHLNARL